MFKYIWNFLIALTMYSSFLDNHSFKRIIIGIGRHIWVLAMFMFDKILQVTVQ